MKICSTNEWEPREVVQKEKNCFPRKAALGSLCKRRLLCIIIRCIRRILSFLKISFFFNRSSSSCRKWASLVFVASLNIDIYRPSGSVLLFLVNFSFDRMNFIKDDMSQLHLKLEDDIESSRLNTSRSMSLKFYSTIHIFTQDF